MTIAVDLGRKATKQTNKRCHGWVRIFLYLKLIYGIFFSDLGFGGQKKIKALKMTS